MVKWKFSQLWWGDDDLYLMDLLKNGYSWEWIKLWWYKRISHPILEKINALQEMKNYPYFWVSGDVNTVWENIIIPDWYCHNIKVKLSRENFPNFEWFNFNLWNISYLDISTRSCYAQSWISIIWKPLKDLTQNDLVALKNWWEIEKDVMLINNWLAKVHIPDDIGILRIFSINRQKKLATWKKLYDIINDWKFWVEWSYWKEWFLIDWNWNILDENNISNAVRLVLPLVWKSHLPYTTEVVDVVSKADLSKVLKDIDIFPDLSDFPFRIWETAKVSLSNWVVWVISECWYDGGSFHISSPLIDPWFSWVIRTEITWNNENRINFIEMMVLVDNLK